MEFKQLEAFVAVVDYGSFSEAARRLYLTQPTISAHIRSLEDELHMKLIIRTTKKTTVTAKGYQLYDSAVRMLDIRNNLLENFTGAHKHMIDLAASTIPSSYLLPELLAAFGKAHPDVYFHSVQSDSAESISRVLDGTVDLALLDRIPEMKAVFFFRSVMMNLYSLPRLQTATSLYTVIFRMSRFLSAISPKILSSSVKKGPEPKKRWICFSKKMGSSRVI